MKPLRILILVHAHLMPPEDTKGMSAEDIAPFKAEHDVITTLRKNGHEVHPVALSTDLYVIRDAIARIKPQVSFNLIESFNDFRSYDQHVVSFLECLNQPYTGCNPRGLTLARDKALTKKILSYHRIRVPAFHVFPIGRKVKRPKSLAFPLLVKSATDDGSIGISQASVVRNDEALRERVEFIHGTSSTDAIAEQYIEGRELYVGVLGNRSLQTLPVWELSLDQLPEGAPRIVTERMKLDADYQKRYKINSRAAELPALQARAIQHLAKRVYRALGLSGYARLDLRMADDGEVYLIEANPNPQIAEDEDLSDSAVAAGINYPQLLDKILKLGMSYHPHGMA